MTTTVKLSSSGLVKVTGGSETTIINVNETYATASAASDAQSTASDAQSTATAANNILTNGSRVYCFTITGSTSDTTLSEHDTEKTKPGVKDYIFPSVDTQGIIIFENQTTTDRHLTTAGTDYVMHTDMADPNRLEKEAHIIFVSKTNNFNWRKIGAVRNTRYIDLV